MFVAVMSIYNEIEFIEINIRQHVNCFDRILVIDGADPRNDKNLISKNGLSNDGTKETIHKLINEFGNKIEYYEMPFATKEDKANFYVTKLKDRDSFLRLDCDQFYTFDDLERMKAMLNKHDTVMYPIINFWKTIDKVIDGGYFKIQHAHAHRFYEGSGFGINHVTLSYRDKTTYCSHKDRMLWTNDIVCYHLGFAREDKARYQLNLKHYITRGEMKTRPEYIACRESFFKRSIPPECKLLDYSGIYPEIFYKRFYPEIFTGKKGSKDGRS